MSAADGPASTEEPGPLRVLLVSPGFAPTPGGVEEHVGRLAAELISAGHRVEVLTARRGLRRARTEQWHGARVRVVPAWRTRALSVAPRLLAEVTAEARRADVVHVHSYHASTSFALLNRSVRGRAVFTPHFHGGGHSTLGRLLHLGYGRLSARLFGSARALICVSRAEERALIASVPAAAGRVRVIPNGVAVAELAAAAPYPGEPPTVLSLGRLEPYKGVDRVVRAVADLPAPTQLVVIGDGSQRDRLRALARELGVSDRVRLVGAVETAVVHRWLRTAAVLVSVSDHEAFGMAAAEAAAAGARVVLSDIPAYREIAGDFLGPAARLVDGHDLDAITAAVAAALDHGDRVETAVPDWADVARQTVEVYRASAAVSAGDRSGRADLPAGRPR